MTYEILPLTFKYPCNFPKRTPNQQFRQFPLTALDFMHGDYNNLENDGPEQTCVFVFAVLSIGRFNCRAVKHHRRFANPNPVIHIWQNFCAIFCRFRFSADLYHSALPSCRTRSGSTVIKIERSSFFPWVREKTFVPLFQTKLYFDYCRFYSVITKMKTKLRQKRSWKESLILMSLYLILFESTSGRARVQIPQKTVQELISKACKILYKFLDYLNSHAETES